MDWSKYRVTLSLWKTKLIFPRFPQCIIKVKFFIILLFLWKTIGFVLVSWDRNYWNQLYHFDFYILGITENQLKFTSSQYWKVQRQSLVHLYYVIRISSFILFPFFNELCFWCVCPFGVPGCSSAAQALGPHALRSRREGWVLQKKL